jgi:lysyl-tRNA synthetase class 2
VAEALADLGGLDLASTSTEALRDLAASGLRAGAASATEAERLRAWTREATRGALTMTLFDLRVEDKLVQPTIIKDYPREISPLTKRHRRDPDLVERFEPYLAGMEIGNAYSELTDPVEQYDRFLEQRGQVALSADDEGVEAHPIDMDFVEAVGIGMPPTGGTGLGIDRLVMILTDAPSIRDVIAFPLRRPARDEPTP